MKYGLSMCLVIFVSCVAAAEEVPVISNRYGYVFGGLGATSDYEHFVTFNSGVGFEYRFYKGLGVNSEISYLAPIQLVLPGFGVWSINGSYHFDKGKSTPFVTAGYSMFFREGYQHLFNIGGGVQRRLKSGHVLRLEVRDHILRDYETYHLYGFRVGWTF